MEKDSKMASLKTPNLGFMKPVIWPMSLEVDCGKA